MNFIFSFILTIFIEFIIARLFFKKEYFKLFSYVFLMNLFTWPIASLLFNNYSSLLYIEIGIILVEWILIKLLLEMKYSKSLLISFLMNIVGFVASIFLTFFLPI